MHFYFPARRVATPCGGDRGDVLRRADAQRQHVRSNGVAADRAGSLEGCALVRRIISLRGSRREIRRDPIARMVVDARWIETSFTSTTDMRTAFIAVPLACAACIACMLGGCQPEPESRGGCEDDPALCPTSTRTATDLSCDCRCVAGWSGFTPTRAFTGSINTCLPPSLNPMTGTPEEKAAISAVGDADYSQRVYKYCSETVATFLDELMEQQQRERTKTELPGMCIGPRIRCSCSTKGATQESTSCSTPCEDTECTSDNCLALLRRDGTIDSSTCECSRVSACGVSTPRRSEPGICTKRLSLRTPHG